MYDVHKAAVSCSISVAVVMGNTLSAIQLSQTHTNKNIKASKNQEHAAFQLRDPERLGANLWILPFSAVFRV